jgi:hypothetical protein
MGILLLEIILKPVFKYFRQSVISDPPPKWWGAQVPPELHLATKATNFAAQIFNSGVVDFGVTVPQGKNVELLNP